MDIHDAIRHTIGTGDVGILSCGSPLIEKHQQIVNINSGVRFAVGTGHVRWAGVAH